MISSWTLRVLRAVTPLLVGLAALALMIAALGYALGPALRALFTTSFTTPFGMAQTLQIWVPIVLLGAGFAIPLRARRYNIGGEGQLLVGAIAAFAVTQWAGGLPGPILIPLMLLAGALAGGVWAGIAGVLLGRFGVNEVLTTVMLNFCALSAVTYVAGTVWPATGSGHPTTTRIPDQAWMPTIGTPPVHVGVLLTAAVLAGVLWWAGRSVLGYEITALGENEHASSLHGVRVRLAGLAALVLGGALGGFAGGIQVSGVHHNVIAGMQSNYLVLGIVVGLLCQGRLVMLPVAALAISVLEVGAGAMQRTADVPSELVLIAEAVILISVLVPRHAAPRLRRVRRNAQEVAA